MFHLCYVDKEKRRKLFSPFFSESLFILDNKPRSFEC